MRKLVPILLLITLVLSLAPGALLAQDAPDQGAGTPDPASIPHIYLPVVAGSNASSSPAVDSPAPTPAPDADWPGDLGWGNQKHGKVTPAERMAAAQRAAALGEQPATVTGVTAEMSAAAMGSSPHFFGPYPNYANSQLPVVSGGNITGGIRKFVDSLPGLGPDAKNNLGQYIPVAVPDTTTYPGSDYYEIAVVEDTEKLDTDLPPPKLPAQVQMALQNKEIDMGHARALLAIDSPSLQVKLFKEIQKNGYSVRKVEEMVQKLKNGEDIVSGKKKIASNQQMPEEFSTLKQHLSDFFKTKVQMTCSANGKGKISIPFANEEELVRIMSMFDKLKEQ